MVTSHGARQVTLLGNTCEGCRRRASRFPVAKRRFATLWRCDSCGAAGQSHAQPLAGAGALVPPNGRSAGHSYRPDRVGNVEHLCHPRCAALLLKRIEPKGLFLHLQQASRCQDSAQVHSFHPRCDAPATHTAPTTCKVSRKCVTPVACFDPSQESTHIADGA